MTTEEEEDFFFFFFFFFPSTAAVDRRSTPSPGTQGRTDRLLCRCFGAPARRVFPDHLITLLDQVIREDPAGAVVVRACGRGTEASAEELVGPPLGAGGWSRQRGLISARSRPELGPSSTRSRQDLGPISAPPRRPASTAPPPAAAAEQRALRRLVLRGPVIRAISRPTGAGDPERERERDRCC